MPVVKAVGAVPSMTSALKSLISLLAGTEKSAMALLFASVMLPAERAIDFTARSELSSPV